METIKCEDDIHISYQSAVSKGAKGRSLASPIAANFKTTNYNNNNNNNNINNLHITR